MIEFDHYGRKHTHKGTVKDDNGRAKKWKYRLPVKYVHDRRPLWWLSQKKRYLIIEMVGILAEKLRIAYLVEQEKEKILAARKKEIKWQEVYDIQKTLQQHRKRLKHYRHYSSREIYSYAPHRLAKIFAVNRSIIYRVLNKYVQTGDVLFLQDYQNQAGAKDSIKTVSEEADSRTVTLVKGAKTWDILPTAGESSLDPNGQLDSVYPSENSSVDLYADLWRFVTINRSSSEVIKEDDVDWYKHSNRDLLSLHREHSTDDYFRTTEEFSDIPGEAYIYKYSTFKRTAKRRRYKSIEI